jgi:hypothetical protein
VRGNQATALLHSENALIFAPKLEILAQKIRVTGLEEEPEYVLLIT